MAQQQLYQYRFLLWSNRIYTPARTTKVSDHLNYRSARMSLSQLDHWVHDKNKNKILKLDKPQRVHSLGYFIVQNATNFQLPTGSLGLFIRSFSTGTLGWRVDAGTNRLVYTYKASDWRLPQRKMHFFLSSSVLHNLTSDRYIFMCSLY